MFEILTGQAVYVPPAPPPGPPDLIAGTLTAGYYGLVPSADLISGDALASLVSLTAGISQNSSTVWMKFSIDGKTVFVPQKNLRNSISWQDIQNAQLLAGTKIITIGANKYKIRLFKGCKPALSKSGDENGYDTISGQGSEWNRLMYHVSGKPFSDVNNTLASEGITVGDWATYSETVLNTTGNGSYSWCQETHAGNTSYRLFRGGNGVSRHNGFGATQNTIAFGWRPVLEWTP